MQKAVLSLVVITTALLTGSDSKSKSHYILECTKLVCTPALGLYTGMDKTSLDTSSGTVFVREDVSGCLRMSQDVHVTSNVITYHCSACHNRTSTYVIT